MSSAKYTVLPWGTEKMYMWKRSKMVMYRTTIQELKNQQKVWYTTPTLFIITSLDIIGNKNFNSFFFQKLMIPYEQEFEGYTYSLGDHKHIWNYHFLLQQAPAHQLKILQKRSQIHPHLHQQKNLTPRGSPTPETDKKLKRENQM